MSVNLELLRIISSVSPVTDIAYQLVTMLIGDRKPQTIEQTELSNIDREEILSTFEKYNRIIREVAISSRIDSAEKVTIEEFYESKGDGKAGLHSDGATLNIGISGSGEKVTKRVYIFEGWREGDKLSINENIIKRLGIMLEDFQSNDKTSD